MIDTIQNIMAEFIQFQPAFSEEFRSNYDFSDVTFKRDFGPWEKGQQAGLLRLDLSSMTLKEMDTLQADLCPGDPTRWKKICALSFHPQTHGFESLPINPWQEYEKYPIKDWQYEVSNNDTRLGYVDWVKHQREDI
jgi:hypothetical protein